MKRTRLFIASLSIALLMAISTALAGQYDLKTITPEINQALKGRQARYQKLQALKQSGAIGENNRGYAAALTGDPTAASVVSAENTDRGVIYRALVDQNALGPNGMREVEKAFAEVQNDKALPGEMVQSASGNWTRK